MLYQGMNTLARVSRASLKIFRPVDSTGFGGTSANPPLPPDVGAYTRKLLALIVIGWPSIASISTMGFTLVAIVRIVAGSTPVTVAANSAVNGASAPVISSRPPSA